MFVANISHRDDIIIKSHVKLLLFSIYFVVCLGC